MPPDYLITVTVPIASADVVHTQIPPAVRERLVRAKNQAQAIKHVVADTLTVKVADTDDVMRVAGRGGKVEIAREA